MTDHRSEHYKRSLGKLVVSANALKAFRYLPASCSIAWPVHLPSPSFSPCPPLFSKCEGDYGKAARSTKKRRQQYYNKESELAELKHHLELAEKIQTSASTGADKDRLQSKIKTAENEMEKAKNE